MLERGQGTPSDRPRKAATRRRYIATILPGQVDLGVTKDDGGGTVGPGTLLTYTLTVENRGTATATGIEITDTLSANTDFAPGTDTDTNPDNNTDTEQTPIVGIRVDLTLTKDDGGVTVAPGAPSPTASPSRTMATPKPPASSCTTACPPPPSPTSKPAPSAGSASWAPAPTPSATSPPEPSSVWTLPSTSTAWPWTPWRTSPRLPSTNPTPTRHRPGGQPRHRHHPHRPPHRRRLGHQGR